MLLRVLEGAAIRSGGKRLEAGAEFEASAADAWRLVAAGYAAPAGAAAEKPAESPAEGPQEPAERRKRKVRGKA